MELSSTDSEQNHEMLREYLEIESVIPAKIGRPTNKLPKGKWRRLMATNFDDESYGQRWQVETVMHMLKSRLSDALTARTYHARNREMGLMSLAHNLMIVRRIRGFLQSRTYPFSCFLSLNGDTRQVAQFDVWRRTRAAKCATLDHGRSFLARRAVSRCVV